MGNLMSKKILDHIKTPKKLEQTRVTLDKIFFLMFSYGLRRPFWKLLVRRTYILLVLEWR